MIILCIEKDLLISRSIQFDIVIDLGIIKVAYTKSYDFYINVNIL